jgi:hypothetical protein
MQVRMRAMQVNKRAIRAPPRVTRELTAALLKVAKLRAVPARVVPARAAQLRAVQLRAVKMPVTRSAAPVVIRAALRVIRGLLGTRVQA